MPQVYERRNSGKMMHSLPIDTKEWLANSKKRSLLIGYGSEDITYLMER